MTEPTVTRVKLPAVRRAIQSSVWAIMPDKLDAILEVIEAHAARGGFTAEEIEARVGDRTKPVGRITGGIQVLPLYGVISPRMDMLSEMSGGTSCEAFGKAFDAAMANPEIGAVLIDCDSPGGNVIGVPELAAKIAAARGQGKPIVAVANGLMASAAYWICSAADEIVASPSSWVGSIGCYMAHEDSSAMQEKVGLKYQVISAGKYKAEGAAGQPLDDEALAFLQSQVDAMMDEFVNAVAKGRDVKASVVRSSYGEGRVLLAKQAKASGMVDRINTLDETIARMAGRKGSATSGARAIAAPLGLAATASNVPTGISAGASWNDAHTGGTLRLTDAQARRILASLEREPDDAPTDEPTPAGDVVPVADPPAPESSPSPRPDAAPEENMPDPTPAVDVTAMLAADRARAAKIRAIGRQEKVSDDVIEAAVTAGKTEAEFALAMSELRAEKLKANPLISVGADRNADRPFKHLGEQLSAIAAHATHGQGHPSVDRRLYAAAATGGATAALGSDGAFAIQKDFNTELLESAFGTGSILKEADSSEVGANADSLEVMYLDETSRATGSRWGGVQVYRGAEADTATAKKPTFGRWECRLEDIIGLAYMTNRLMQDASSIASVFKSAFTDELVFTVENEMVRGSGAGQMLGIIGTAANRPTVSVAKETGQIADTLVAENIGKMWKSVHPRSRLSGSWYYNVELEDQFDSLQIGTGTSGQVAFLPPGGLSGKPYATIKGRPLIPLEYASGAGDVGDFFFADWKRYKVITKGGIQADESVHVRFLTNEQAFRWVMRINGAPKDKSAITPFKATDTALRLSPFVTLAAR